MHVLLHVTNPNFDKAEVIRTAFLERAMAEFGVDGLRELPRDVANEILTAADDIRSRVREGRLNG